MDLNQLDLFHLAVLRSAVEGDENDSYFGSTANLRFWKEGAVALNLVSVENTRYYDVKATDLGTRLYIALDMKSLPKKRAYEWPNTKDLVKRAKSLLA